MAIVFRKDLSRFILSTAHTTYAFDILQGRYLRHLYYGRRRADIATMPAPAPVFLDFAPYIQAYGAHYSPDAMPTEISFFGSGDFRATSLRLTGADGTGATDFVYDGYRIRRGRRDIPDLPRARATDRDRTLEVYLCDEVTGCRLTLCYTVFADCDVISRSMVLENRGEAPVRLDKCMSLETYLPRSDMDRISLWGRYGVERLSERVPLHHGLQSIASRRGASSHQQNPFFALCDHKATEDCGEVYGFNFVYSGSFLNEIEVDQMGGTRVMIGLGSENFAYTVDPGESFASPEAVMTYSAAGVGGMSRQFHRFIRDRIMPPVALEPHPVVLNTWEACYFNIDEGTLLSFAEEAGRLGFDMLVMDDGWFGARHNDLAGLGDWVANADKFPRGLGPFADDIRARGVKFGIWVEPEMVNPDSDLYRAHPEWALHVPGREPMRSRHQLVLDMANPAVVDYLIALFDKTFDGVKIDYFKWDMNRNMCQVGSPTLPPERQGEVSFRYMKGVYRLLGHFRTRHPEAVIETCSGGGGRYDLGMMQYGIQIWTSDNTNPYYRTLIQSSALIGYPAATMSCHVSDPHGDLRSLDYRYKVALGGMLGYELHILRMDDAVKADIAAQIAEYKQLDHIIRLGDYYAIVSPQTHTYDAHAYATADGAEILLTVVEKEGCPVGTTRRLPLRAADKNATYTDRRTGTRYTGEALRRGITLPLTGEQDSALLLHLVRDQA